MTDRRVPLVVVYGLVLLSVLGLVSVSTLAFFSKDVPEVLSAITSAALGGLTALLASTRSEPGPT